MTGAKKRLNLDVTRRGFVKLAAVTSAATVLAGATVGHALAEEHDSGKLIASGEGRSAHTHDVPRLRQNGMRRVGDGGEWPCHQDRRR